MNFYEHKKFFNFYDFVILFYTRISKVYLNPFSGNIRYNLWKDYLLFEIRNSWQEQILRIRKKYVESFYLLALITFRLCVWFLILTFLTRWKYDNYIYLRVTLFEQGFHLILHNCKTSPFSKIALQKSQGFIVWSWSLEVIVPWRHFNTTLCNCMSLFIYF